MEGELPAGWTRAPLREVADLCLGKMLDKAKNEGQPHPYLRNLNVRWGFFDLSDLAAMRFEDHETERYSVRPGDVVVCEGGEPGRCAVWRGPGTIRFQKALHRVRCGPRLEPDFLAYHLRADANAGDLEPAFTGSTIKHLTGVALAAHRVALPPIDEQKRIVARLDELLSGVRRAREALSDVPRVLDQLRRSVLAAAFRGELTSSWRAANPDVEPASALLDRLRAERRARWEAANPKKKYTPPEPVDPDAEELPDTWTWCRLVELAANEPNAITDGPFGSKLKSEHYSSSGVRVIRLGNIGIGKFIDDVRAYIPPERLEELQKHQVFEGDLLIAALADPVGRCCEVPPGLGQAIVKADCIRFKVVPAVDRRLVMHWLNSPAGRAQSAGAAHGVGRVRMNMEEIRALAVPILPPEEAMVLRQIIAERMASIDALEEVYRTSIAQLPRIEQSILARAFRGELLYDNQQPVRDSLSPAQVETISQ